jgi:hypothetical protein
MMRTIKWQ